MRFTKIRLPADWSRGSESPIRLADEVLSTLVKACINCLQLCTAGTDDNER